MQQTLVIVKPDGVQRGLVGKILARFEERGLKIVALKMVQVSRELAEKHYAVHKGKFFYEDPIMKMKNDITSPRHGVIKAIHVEVGAMVAKGQLLIEFE